MIKEGYFRIDFKATETKLGCKDISVKLSECYFLPYRTEETHMHESSTVYRHAVKQIKQEIGNYYIEIKHIYELTDYEEIK